MMFPRVSSLRLFSARFLAAAATVVSASAQEIVYDNTKTFLDRYAGEAGEFGDWLILAGTARVLTDIQFEYFGDFSQQGDELAKVRIYANEKAYDLYRREPTTVLYESGYFPINPGYSSKHLSVPNVLLPDEVTFTIEFGGIAETETAGLLLYSPPSVGRSFNEFWRRNDEGFWQPIIYSKTDLSLKANAAVRLTAKEAVRLHGLSLSPARNFGFAIKGLKNGSFVVESSTNLVNWTQVESRSPIGEIVSFERPVEENKLNVFFRVRAQ